MERLMGRFDLPNVPAKYDELAKVYGVKETVDFWFMTQENYLISEIADKITCIDDAEKHTFITSLILYICSQAFPLSKALLC